METSVETDDSCLHLEIVKLSKDEYEDQNAD